jgi:hypothetical protein
MTAGQTTLITFRVGKYLYSPHYKYKQLIYILKKEDPLFKLRVILRQVTSGKQLGREHKTHKVFRNDSKGQVKQEVPI